jgi:hypothetical protein
MSYPYFADPEHTLVQIAPGACLTLERFLAEGGATQSVAAFALFQSLDGARAGLLDQVRNEAGARILARYPLHVQLNAAARAIELTDFKITRPLNPEEAVEEAAIRGMYAWIKSVRAVSALKEGEIAAITESGAASAYDIASGWPA